MRYHALFLTLLFATLSTMSCGTPVATPAPIILRLGGSTTLWPALDIWTDDYTETYPHVHFERHSGDPQSAKERLLEQRLDIVTSSWELEAAELTDTGLQAILVAWDGIAIVVHPRNTFTNTTIAQIQSIYAGHILDWRILGGQAGETIVVSREDGSGTRHAFESMVMGQEGVTLAAIVMPSNIAVVDYVATHPQAIGYVSMAYLTDQVRALSVENEYPTPQSVGQGTYRLSRPLYLLTKVNPSEDVQSFVNYVLSPKGQSLITVHYWPLR